MNAIAAGTRSAKTREARLRPEAARAAAKGRIAQNTVQNQPTCSDCGTGITPPRGWLFMGPYMVPIPRRVLISEIQRAVAEYYGLPVEMMKSPRRQREVVKPRHIAMYLSREITRRSFPEIGRRFGGRDHTTVLAGVRAIAARRETEPELAKVLGVLTVSIRSGA